MYLRTPKWKGDSYGSQGWNTEKATGEAVEGGGIRQSQGVAMQELEAPLRIQSLS